MRKELKQAQDYSNKHKQMNTDRANQTNMNTNRSTGTQET